MDLGQRFPGGFRSEVFSGVSQSFLGWTWVRVFPVDLGPRFSLELSLNFFSDGVGSHFFLVD